MPAVSSLDAVGHPLASTTLEDEPAATTVGLGVLLQRPQQQSCWTVVAFVPCTRRFLSVRVGRPQTTDMQMLGHLVTKRNK